MVFQVLLNNFMEVKFLSVEKLKKNNLESVFGFIWIFIQPLVMLYTLYFFFRLGLNFQGDVNGVPLIVFMFSGQLVWLLMSSCVNDSPLIFWRELQLINSFNYPISILPIVEFLAKFYAHVVILIAACIIFTQQGYPPSIYYLNFIYIWITLICFFTPLMTILGVISVYFQDTNFIVKSLMMPIFWLTPVLFEPIGNVIIFQKLFNPFNYFIEHYRETIIYKEWFFEGITYDIYMWLIIVVLNLVAINIFNKVRTNIPDVI